MAGPRPRPQYRGDGRFVGIRGFEEFQRDLAEAAADLRNVIRETNYQLALMMVQRARQRAGYTGGVAVKAAKSLRAARSVEYAALRYGGPRYPYAMGAEFGSNRYKQFKPYRRKGYWLYQSRYEIEHYVMERTFYEAFTRATARAFPNGERGSG